jgi:hypothetical protein
MQSTFSNVRCVDAATIPYENFYSDPNPLSVKETGQDTRGFMFKVFVLCHATSFDEVRTSIPLSCR